MRQVALGPEGRWQGLLRRLLRCRPVDGVWRAAAALVRLGHEPLGVLDAREVGPTVASARVTNTHFGSSVWLQDARFSAGLP